MKKCSCSYLGELEAEDNAIGIGGTGGTRRPGVDGADLFVTPGIYAICIILEARVRTVDAMDPTVCVEALASLLIAKSFSVGSDSTGSSIQSSCSYCCLLFFIQNLHTRYVTTAIKKTPAITPPAIAGTFGFEFDLEVGAGVGEDCVACAIHSVFWHSSQFRGIRAHTWPLGQSGQDGVALGQPCTQRLKIEPYETI